MAKYLHKYVSDGEVFYRESDSPARPGGNVNLTVQEWQGRASGDKVKTALQRVHQAFKEEKLEEKEKGEEKEKKAGIIMLADHIRKLAQPVMEAPAKEAPAKETEPEQGRWLHMFFDDKTGQVIATLSTRRKMSLKEIPATLTSTERGSKVIGGMANIVKKRLVGIAEDLGIDVGALKQMWHGTDKQTGTNVLILSVGSPKTEAMRGKEIGKPTFLKQTDLSRIMKIEQKTAAEAVRDLASLIEEE